MVKVYVLVVWCLCGVCVVSEFGQIGKVAEVGSGSLTIWK